MEYNYYYEQNSTTLGQYMAKTYAWMCLGLVITFATAMYTAISGLYISMINSGAIFVLTIVELLLVILFSAKLQSLSSTAAAGIFAAYSLLNGLVFSTYFILYNTSTLLFAFLVSAVYFGVMALYGYLTQRDLSGWGSILFGGLIALLVMGFIGMFFGFGAMDFLYCAFGLLVFMGYTAYDNQKLKAMYYATGGQGELAAKLSLMGALQLYLDFVNIFLYVLRMLGRRRRN